MGNNTDHIKNIERITLSKEWATLNRIDYDYEFKDGRVKRVSRESYDRGDGCAILLYNREKRTLILTRQFRMPIYQNDHTESMSIEVCAGAIDKNESPKVTIIREVEEEVGYRILDAELVQEAYMSPGALTEKLYLYLAPYDESMKVNAGGGVATEDEDIEVMEMSFDDAITMIKNKQIVDAKTIMLIQYARLNEVLM
ncbi:MAG: NUDIX domain-containing protein [Psychroserpens sp.]|uniref:NUDIX domain-containing protein n=1 Tax=Psychroserpens sp. TaxID=2020870 RepID=UPI003C72861E